jgi:mono/diheme cytochrome c family protein
MKKPNPTSPRAASSGGGAVAADAGLEPVASRAPVPVLLVALLAAALYWGSMYVLEYGGQADARVHSPYLSYKQIQDLLPKGEEEMQKAKGLLVYSRICSPCHQNDGGGSTAQNAPPLAGSEWVLAKDPSRLIRIVLHGLSGPIEVKGKPWGAGTMPPWKDTLNDEEIASVLAFVRNSWGNKAPTAKLDEIDKARKDTATQSGAMTAPDLLKVTLKE